MSADVPRIPVTLIPGDGIGPECVGSARRIVEATGAPIDWELAEAGAAIFTKGIASGVPQEPMDSIGRTRVALKGPLETPVGFGEKSANVTLRTVAVPCVPTSAGTHAGVVNLSPGTLVRRARMDFSYGGGA